MSCRKLVRECIFLTFCMSQALGGQNCGDRSVLGNPSWVGKLECIRVKASPPVASQELAWILVSPSVSQCPDLTSGASHLGVAFLVRTLCSPCFVFLDTSCRWSRPLLPSETMRTALHGIHGVPLVFFLSPFPHVAILLLKVMI